MNSPVLNEKVINSSLTNGYWRVSVVSECQSTQDLLLTRNSKPGDVITTEYQSAGRGRMERKFDSPPTTGLLFSFVYQPTDSHNNLVSRDTWGAYSLIAGDVVSRVLSEVVGVTYLSKWPNDIVVERNGELKKVCGMLAQVVDDSIHFGIGINVTTQPHELPVPTATSILIDSKKVIDRNILLPHLLTSLKKAFDSYSGGADFRPSYLENSFTVGKNVEIHAPSGEITYGQAVGITLDGALILSDNRIISVGDIIHASPSK
jgi:BirA family biotin operon repressor/biotin-[acetyl-CoA-carboxylase] ligase